MNLRFSSEPAEAVAVDALFVGVSPSDLTSPKGALASLDQRFGGQLVADLVRRRFKATEGATCAVPGMGRTGARDVVFVGLGSGGPGALRTVAGKIGREARSMQAQSVAVLLPGVDADTGLRVAEAAAAGNYAWQVYKPEDERTPATADWTFLSPAADAAAVRASAVRAKWQAWARDLVNAPAADLYPESLAAKARELAALPGVTVEVWDFEKCRAEGLVGIVGVGQGSARPGVLIHVSYRCAGGAKDHVALVGKGVTFDSGGLSIKPTDGMLSMRCDMGGAATMLATTGIAAELGLAVNLDTFCPAVENMVSGDSYKLGDVLRYRNGVTVEINNTDAEGRLILADALILASQLPTVSTIVDAATLTGACVVALGDDFTGLFTESDGLAGELAAAADANGEGLWRMPLYAGYKDQLKSDFAQMKNSGGRAAGAITAALFLQAFVGSGPSGAKPAWAHLDIAGPAFMDKGTGRYAAGGTGEMVRSLATFLARRAT